MIISIIAAIDKNRGIGKDGKMLVDLPPDLKHFKEITLNHIVVAGRKTYQSIGQFLPERTNMVLSRDSEFEAVGCMVLPTVKKALEYAKQSGEEEVFFIGGGDIYEQVIKYADKLYLTLMDKTWSADTFFPKYNKFKNLASESEEQEYQGLKFKYIELIK